MRGIVHKCCIQFVLKCKKPQLLRFGTFIMHISFYSLTFTTRVSTKDNWISLLLHFQLRITILKTLHESVSAVNELKYFLQLEFMYLFILNLSKLLSNLTLLGRASPGLILPSCELNPLVTARPVGLLHCPVPNEVMTTVLYFCKK